MTRDDLVKELSDKLGGLVVTSGTRIILDGVEMADAEIEEMVNCCGIAVFTEWWTDASKKLRPEIAEALVAAGECTAREQGYTSIVCTYVPSKTDPIADAFAKRGWDQVWELVNRRTGNTIIMVMKDL